MFERNRGNTLTTASKAARFSSLRGKPSIRNLSFPLSSIACWRRFTVTSEGTIFPSLIILLIIRLKVTKRKYINQSSNSISLLSSIWASHRTHIPIFRTRIHFCPKKITSTKMGKTKVLNNVCTLCPLSTARTTY